MPPNLKSFAKNVKAMRTEGIEISNDTRLRIYQITESHRKTINDAIRRAANVDGQEINQVSVPKLSELIRTESEQMADEVKAALIDAENDAVKAAIHRVEMIADTAELEGIFFAPSADLALTIQSYAADKVKTIVPELMPKVNAILGRAGMGTITPFDAMKGIDEVVGINGSGGVSYQAERIVRTEVNNIYSKTLDSQMNIFAQHIPNHGALKKTWKFGYWREGRREDHQQMDGVTVPYNESFVLPNGHKLMFPHDPDGAAEDIINCACGFVIDSESILEALEL